MKLSLLKKGSVHKKKTFALFSCVILILVPACKSVQLESGVPIQAKQQVLYVKEKTSNKKIKLKKNETVLVYTNKNRDSTFAIVKLWDDKGMYLAPYTYIPDSILIDSVNMEYYNTSYFEMDTVLYQSFDDISQINFRKNMRLKRGIAWFTFAVGGIVTFAASTLAIRFRSSAYPIRRPILIGSGLIIAGLSVVRLKVLEQLNAYPMDKFEFVLE